jgi:hypothetical protein
MKTTDLMEKEFKEGVIAFIADASRDANPYKYQMVMEWEPIIQQNYSWYQGWDFAHQTKLYSVVMQELNVPQQSKGSSDGI